ncbi:hypothetical protein TNCT_386511 [Trichonephila clavata]|uniref:Uncharacterized protein n=1 Tax=Trichonephila clavata TaxID=2740835 RepID=A0A8X6EXD5_TRICU|nr:hypothetical protein TNCT_386511 [Trichonephila clavata]
MNDTNEYWCIATFDAISPTPSLSPGTTSRPSPWYVRLQPADNDDICMICRCRSTNPLTVNKYESAIHVPDMRLLMSIRNLNNYLRLTVLQS